METEIQMNEDRYIKEVRNFNRVKHLFTFSTSLSQ